MAGAAAVTGEEAHRAAGAVRRAGVVVAVDGEAGSAWSRPRGKCRGAICRRPSRACRIVRKQWHLIVGGVATFHSILELTRPHPPQHTPSDMRPMFDPRPPVEFVRIQQKPAPQAYTGIAQYVGLFETDTPEPNPPFVSYKERKTAERAALMKVHEERLALEKEDWDPKKDGKATEDPYRTLVVARLSYDTTEKKLRREFEQYGAIKSLRVVTDEDGKPRGYGFVEFEKEADMKSAYKRADGKKIDGRRILVDVERGRTVKGWVPRRLGGGLGGSRKGPGEESSGRGGGNGGGGSSAGGGGGGYGGGSGRARSRSPDRSREDRGGGRDRGGGGDRDRRRSRSRSPGRRYDRGGGDRNDRGGVGFRDNKRRRSRSPDRRGGGGGGGGGGGYYGPSSGSRY